MTRHPRTYLVSVSVVGDGRLLVDLGVLGANPAELPHEGIVAAESRGREEVITEKGVLLTEGGVGKQTPVHVGMHIAVHVAMHVAMHVSVHVSVHALPS